MRYHNKIANKRYNGLPIKAFFLLELNCLHRLTKNFECICKKKRKHFPDLIKYNRQKYTFKLRNCGYSINKIIKNKKLRKSYKVKNVNEQINCILYNLHKVKVKHLDIFPYTIARNLCINSNGDLSLIDFDLATINNKCICKKIKKDYKLYHKNCNYYNELKKMIIRFLKCMNMISK